MENQDNIFYLSLPNIIFKNCFAYNEKKDFYNVILKNESLSFLVILEHDIHGIEHEKITIESLYNEKIDFSVYGFLILNNSFQNSVERFNDLMKNCLTMDILETLNKWSVFKTSYEMGKAELIAPEGELKKTLLNIINNGEVNYL